MNKNINPAQSSWLLWLVLAWLVGSSCAGQCEGAVRLSIHFAETNTPFRPLHGINKGPQVAGGLFTVTHAQRDLGIPFTRLHDCHWPNPDVVDIHAVFPDPKADPANPASYDFNLTDDYIAALRDTGAKIIYRLGESIEHTKVKRFVHPPADMERWAEVCLGIIRHYNEGWANGFRHDIQYWEIWNEPENRPVMWSGSDEQFFQLYKIAASKIKSAFPKAKVGGPGFGYYGQFQGGRFEPSAFLAGFLTMCREEKIPLDFLSWHCYTANPSELGERARAIRALLDTNGFQRAESHLNEWNYLPGNSWKPISKNSEPAAREAFYREMAGPAGAAFITTALLELQDAPVDICNLFHGEVGGFGLFSENGVPLHNYYALLACQSLFQAGRRVAVTGAVSGRLAVQAGLSEGHAQVLLSNYSENRSSCSISLKGLPWGNKASYVIQRLDAEHRWKPAETGAVTEELALMLPRSSVALIQLKPARQP